MKQNDLDFHYRNFNENVDPASKLFKPYFKNKWLNVSDKK